MLSDVDFSGLEDKVREMGDSASPEMSDIFSLGGVPRADRLPKEADLLERAKSYCKSAVELLVEAEKSLPEDKSDIYFMASFMLSRSRDMFWKLGHEATASAVALFDSYANIRLGDRWEAFRQYSLFASYKWIDPLLKESLAGFVSGLERLLEPEMMEEAAEYLGEHTEKFNSGLEKCEQIYRTIEKAAERGPRKNKREKAVDSAFFNFVKFSVTREPEEKSPEGSSDEGRLSEIRARFYIDTGAKVTKENSGILDSIFSLEKSEKLRRAFYDAGEALSNIAQEGEALRVRGDYSKMRMGKLFLQEALKLTERMEDSVLMKPTNKAFTDNFFTFIHLSLARIETFNKEYGPALLNALKAEKRAGEDEENLYAVYKAYASLFSRKEDTLNALTYSKKAYQLIEKMCNESSSEEGRDKELELAGECVRLFSAQSDYEPYRKDIESGIGHAGEIYRAKMEEGVDIALFKMGNLHNALADYHLNKEEFEKAVAEFEKARECYLEYCEHEGKGTDGGGSIISDLMVAYAYIRNEDFERAGQHYSRFREAAEDSGTTILPINFERVAEKKLKPVEDALGIERSVAEIYRLNKGGRTEPADS